MKVCNKCGIEKELSEFYKDITKKYGVSNKCKICTAEYNRSEEHKISKMKYLNSDKGKQRSEKYNKSEERRESSLKYIHSDNGKKVRDNYSKSEVGKEVIKRANSKQCLTEYGKARNRARAKINRKINSGEIMKQTYCDLCGVDKKIQAHHFSYEKGFECEVNWLCPKCHRFIHSEINKLGCSIRV